jgi:hypothetical protein
MLENIGNIFFLETVVDSLNINMLDRPFVNRPSPEFLPTLTAPAAAIPKIDSRNAGVLGQRIPTLLNPCFFR